MNIYFDCEFTGLFQKTQLISLGLIDENGRSFYAEFNNIDIKSLDKWIIDNVVNNLKFNNKNNLYLNTDNSTIVKGNKEEINKYLKEWLSKYDNEEIQFISDVCHYDFVLLIDLLSENALNLPSNISAVCYDVNNIISNKLSVNQKEAFDISREEYVKYNLKLNIEGEELKHNSLFDAQIIKIIYEGR